MTMQANHIDEWLDRAFRLAFFLHGDRTTAKQIAASAMNKLETASNAQFKRLYYTPTGRSENAKATRSRVSLNDLQLLQRLVFIESEKFEREIEQRETVCESSLLKFFVKHLVRISLKRNSFYVALGVSRILHNYGTADAMEIYNVVVQNPDRVHDDYYYRSRKGVLMKELRARFGELLETTKINRGEERFCSQTDAENLSETARECLEIFTPWNSLCNIPDKFNPFDDVIKPFHFDKDDPDAEHRIEVNRIHAALHPHCFARLTNALNLPAPAEKMEIPKFMINANHTNLSDDNDWRNPPGLETDELQAIKITLAAEAENRKAMSAGFLRVIADGIEQTQINLIETDSAKFDLDGGAELIEIYGDGETLLATHLLSYDNLPNGAQSQTIQLEGGQKITFDFTLQRDEFNDVSSINFAVRYAETVWHKRTLLALRRAKFALANSFNQPILKPALTFGLLLLALTFGWLVFRTGEKKDEVVNAPTPNNQNNANLFQTLPPQEKKEVLENKSAPKDLKESDKIAPKQVEKPETPKQTPPREVKKEVAPPKEISIEVPRRELANNNKNLRKNEIDENGVLRLPIRESNNFPNEKIATRGKNKLRGQSFGEINQIYIEISGDQILGKQIAERIAAELGKSVRFKITDDKETADAALKIYVRHEADGDSREDASVAAIVRLVNAEGFVVYPNRRKISGWKYVGTLAKLPSRIASDLAKSK